ncbi:FAD-binding oxidoreductase [Ottowia pentelensis]|uniref:FAD-binding oxidoreductase n=1 Tax=Ottowia pentelensis TaxID=511108 RepID=A0ABV6PWQ4_9BURK|nr:FAD-binding oxidoreductase [Ottowia sp.]
MTLESPVQDSLAARLTQRLGPRGVLLQAAERAPYEASARHAGGRARGVLRPADAQELAWTLKELVTAGAHVVTQGAATGLVGGATPTTDGSQWVLSTQRLRDVLSIDPVNRSATVAAGFRLSELNRAAAEHGLSLPIDLGADPTLGGMVATNTGGARLIRFGGARENLLGVEAVLAHPAGQRVGSSRALRKNNTGLDWAQLLCGTFGAFGVVTRATVRLHSIQQQSATALVAVDSVEAAIEMVCDLEQAMGEFVSAFEGLSRGALQAVARHQGGVLPFADVPAYAVLMEVSSAVPPGCGLDLEAMLMAWLEQHLAQGRIVDAVIDKPAQLWRIRHAISEAVQSLGRMVAFDLSVARSAFAPFRARALSLIDELLPAASVCDFGHLGDGGVHLNMVVPQDTPADAIGRLRDAIYDAVVREFGGSFSAEHGVGPYNQAYYHRCSEPAMQAMAGVLQRQLDTARVLGNVWLGEAGI